MTLDITKFFNAIKARLTGQSARSQDLVKLSRQLGLTGQRIGGCKDFQLVATEMGHDQILFKSGTRVQEGEKLNIELPIPGFDRVKATATVGWVICSTTNWNGQLKLTTNEAQRATIAEYTRLQRFAQG